MTKAAMLWVVPCTCAPHENILNFLYQAPMKVITKIFNGAATSTLKSKSNHYREAYTKITHPKITNSEPSCIKLNRWGKIIILSRTGREIHRSRHAHIRLLGDIQQKEHMDPWNLVAVPEALCKFWQDPSLPTFSQAVYPDSAVGVKQPQSVEHESDCGSRPDESVYQSLIKCMQKTV